MASLRYISRIALLRNPFLINNLVPKIPYYASQIRNLNLCPKINTFLAPLSLKKVRHFNIIFFIFFYLLLFILFWFFFQPTYIIQRNYSGEEPLTLDLIKQRVLLVLRLYDKIEPSKVNWKFFNLYLYIFILNFK